jgi:hypothetical protein
MTKLEFLKRFFDNKGYGSKAAIQSLITIQLEDEDSSGAFKKIPFAVYIEGGKFFTLIDGAPEYIEGNVEAPFSHMDDRFTLPDDFHPILKGKGLETTFGLLLFNVILFWEPFQGIAPYVNKGFTKKVIEGLLASVMVDNPKEGETVPEGKVAVRDCLKFTENCYFLEGLGAHFVKPGGIDTLTVSPAILKRKKELMEIHKHELSDPVVFTSIAEELVEMDRKEMMSGPSKNFFINDKFIHTARKRMFIVFGIEQGPDGNWVPLANSLDDGIDPEEIVTYVNTAVAGAYSRSMATGEGGSQVKEVLRLIGRSKVAGTDCESVVGEPIVLTKKDARNWIGGYHVVNKKAVLIEEGMLDGLMNKPIFVRVPQFCVTIDGDWCKTCLGEGLGMYGSRLSAEVVRVPTEAMLTRMKAHHQAGANNVTLDLESAIK